MPKICAAGFAARPCYRNRIHGEKTIRTESFRHTAKLLGAAHRVRCRHTRFVGAYPGTETLSEISGPLRGTDPRRIQPVSGAVYQERVPLYIHRPAPGASGVF